MEATAAMMYDTTQHVTIAERAKSYIKTNRITIEALAADISYARPTLSRYLSGSYPSDPTEIEEKLTRYLDEHDPGSAQKSEFCPSAISIKQRPSFFESNDARNVIGICKACQQYGRMGEIIGASGFGKTTAIKYFSRFPRVAYIRCNAVMGHRDLIREIERALGLPKAYGSVSERLGSIIDFFTVNTGYLLVVDEADKLLNKNTQTKMDTLRDLYDNTKVGIVLAGEKALKTLIACYLDRMENRIIYHYEMAGLSAQELGRYLDGYNIAREALVELQGRAYSEKKGCFRLLDTTLTNVFDLLDKNGSDTITLDIIRQASNWMPL